MMATFRADLTLVPPAPFSPRPAALAAKKARVVAAGPKHLQVLFDFDHTLTRFVRPDGQPLPMCHCIVEHSPLMPAAFRAGYAQLWADQKKGREDGTWDMSVWWARSHALMVEHGLRRQWLPDMVCASGIALRDGCRELFGFLAASDVPVLIVSAGFREIILEVLKRDEVLSENVRIVANEMAFDDSTGLLTSIAEPVLHSECKASVGLRYRDYFASVGRRNVVLAGDSVTDCDCLNNIVGLEESICVGFFNAPLKNLHRAEYENAFDLLLSNEGLAAPGDLDLVPLAELLKGLIAPEGDGGFPSVGAESREEDSVQDAEVEEPEVKKRRQAVLEAIACRSTIP
mmetsp:Transcript_28221/g.61384  ORF Transcript_28221/g.61384 Transcript_28221/m.61384 type:complete len:344 (+) Transcript_28221:57-1088(+)